MAIEISGIPSSQTSVAHTEAVSKVLQTDPSGRTGQVTQAGGRAQDDRVSLTGTAERLRMLEEQVSNLPVVDSQRVETIRAQTTNGSYKIDAAKVASKFLNFETTFSGLNRTR